MRCALLLSLLNLAGATITFTYKNCNDKTHGKVTGLDVQPPNPVAGDNITVTATVAIDKATTAIKSDLVFAKLFHNKFDGCNGATIKAPLGIATVVIPPPGCPLAVTQTAKFIRYVQTSKNTPKASTTSHLEGTDQDGEPFICVDMTLTNKAEQDAVAGSDVHPERAAQIAELKAMLGMTWTPVAHPRFANQKPGASKDLCGVKGDQQKIIKEAIARGEISEYHADANAAVPDSFDSAANWPQCAKVILDIRDQSNCGCCWAFGGTSAATDRMCIATNATLLLPLSAQDVCFNSNFDGCDGGQITTPWSYIKSTGAVTGSQQQPDDGKTDPFKGMGFCSSFSLPHCHHHGPTHGDPYPAEGAQGCAKQSSPQGPTSCDSGAKAPHNEFNSDKYTFSGQTISPNGESSIQQAIMEGGPVEVAFTVYSDFENYGGGIYQHKSGGQVGGHAVKMVGWGVDNGVKYWKIANSWNPYWGEKGYFRIIRGQNEGGIESQVTASAANAKWSKRAPGPAPGPSPGPVPPMPGNCGAHFQEADCEAAATEGCHWCPKFGMGMCFNKQMQCPPSGNVVV